MILELVQNQRPGKRFASGATQRQVDYYDFVIDGAALSQLIQGDLVSCLWLPVNDFVTKAVRRLLLEAPADFPDNRRSLYICPECGDLGCGAVSVVIEADADTVIWRDFGYQNNYEDGFSPLDQLNSVTFDRESYETLLRALLAV